jgi:putative PIN family toxin of toxin-antitoxin system
VIRATLDVNVLVSGFPAVTGAPSELLARWSNLEYELVISEHILDELAAVWGRPYWRARYSVDRVRATMRRLRTQAVIVEPDATVRGIANDEEDDLVLATAVAGDVDFLVTGDRQLQALGRFRHVTILSPRQFLDLLEAEANQTI